MTQKLIISDVKMEETVALIKSCIISKKGGVPVNDLNDEFQKLVGECIPYRRLGFSSLRALLRTIDGLQIWHNCGEEVLKINDSKVSHLDRLIRNQKMDCSKTKDNYYKQFMRNNGNLRFNSNERREKNRLIYNTHRANRRERDFAYHRNTNLFQTNGVYKNNFLCEKENHHPIIIETNQLKKYDNVYEPVANGLQLLGDDFFLQLAIRNLHLPIWRYKDSLALHCGLCISGQTISDCVRALKNINTISKRVMILLGSVDIYNNRTFDEMKEDMTELLQILRFKFHLSNSAITICTLPPLANLSIHAYKNQNLAFFCFNNWIRSLSDEPSTREPSFVNYSVIDLYTAFVDETYTTNFDWFQTQPRRVSGTKHSYVLWNAVGRKRVMNLMYEEENVDYLTSFSSLSNSMN